MLDFGVKIQIHNFWKVSNKKINVLPSVLNLDILVYTSCQVGPPAICIFD